ncbi:MAG TPA: FAD-binding oxidoreductase [Mycobacteriales bacterium]|nr:FAD-binding oxidoreductase [Mycobacteriales bacterium]
MSSEAVELDSWSVGGIAPSSVVSPTDVPSLAEALVDAAGRGDAIGVCGGRSKIQQGAAPDALDVMIRTVGLDRIVEHAAGDLVVTVQSGVRLADLQVSLGPAGQWLALDPPEAGATIGGVVAAGSSGPCRLRYGTPRDLLVGITVVLADGTVAKSGGKVVKNVAGYDLGKLFTGSFGTLGVIAECTFRLHPLPPVRRVVTAKTDTPAAAAARVHSTGATPSAMEWNGQTLTVVVESFEAAAEIQAADIARAIDGEISDALPDDFGQLPAGQVGVKITHRLGALTEVIADIGRLVPNARLRAHVGSGVVHAGTDDGGLGWLDVLRAAIGKHDGQVVVVTAPDELKKDVDVWGPARGIEIMRRIKDQFDPEHRMSPGRFVGGL